MWGRYYLVSIPGKYWYRGSYCLRSYQYCHFFDTRTVVGTLIYQCSSFVLAQHWYFPGKVRFSQELNLIISHFIGSSYCSCLNWKHILMTAKEVYSGVELYWPSAISLLFFALSRIMKLGFGLWSLMDFRSLTKIDYSWKSFSTSLIYWVWTPG